jgi:hypothetical protein
VPPEKDDFTTNVGPLTALEELEQKNKPEPEKEPKPEKAPEPEKEPEPDVDLAELEEGAGLSDLEPVLAEITQKLDLLTAQAEKGKPEAGEDDVFEEADEATKTLHAEVQQLRSQFNEITTAIKQHSEEVAYKQLVTEVKQAQTTYGASKMQITTTMKYLAEHPEAAEVLRFDEALLRVHPELRSRTGVAAPTRDNAAGGGERVAKIVEDAAAGNKPPKPFNPGPGERFEDIGNWINRHKFNQPE